jgi:hypothetical protein
MATEQPYCIFTANGVRHAVTAPSLRTAIRRFDKKGQGGIVAACEAACMPPPATDAVPFLAVFLQCPDFKPPEDLG